MDQTAQPAPTPISPKRFSPRTLILIVVLAIVAIILIFFALNMNSNAPAQTPGGNNTETGAQPTSSVEKTATIAFSPTSVDLATSTSATVDIIVTAGNTPITGAQVEINFDPTVVRNPRILPPDTTNSLFGTATSFIELFNEVDPKDGTINYAIGIQPTGNPVVGAGSIGKLTFTVVRGNTPSSQISFGEGTAVTISGADESVLNTTTPLTITLQSGADSSRGL